MSSASTASEPASTSSALSSKTDNQRIWINVKSDISEKAVRKFVEYMGCTVEKIIPPNGQLYVIAPPPGVKAEKMLPKFESHPWIERVSVK